MNDVSAVHSRRQFLAALAAAAALPT
ncbi:MAG: hypothetical protein JWM75_5, partial [Sphingomonas bacterium]|nr:hypothetical protein [Sphingomonas bacterium]